MPCSTQNASLPAQPVFGFVVMGGPTNGASVASIRLANELARRNYVVHLWWAMDRPHAAPLDERISQHWLFHSFRYMGPGPRGLKDLAGRMVSGHYSDMKRAHVLQKRPHILKALWRGQLQLVCGGLENHDRALLRRFTRQLVRLGVTHLLPSLEILCPWAAAAQRQLPHSLRYAVTFQGYELYSNYARELGLEDEFYAIVRRLVDDSAWPAIAVSEDYIERIVQDVGVSRDRLVAIHPGVPVSDRMPPAQAHALVRERFPEYDSERPLVTFVGRRDKEKGIDLLLYAASILRRSGINVQIAVCGPTVFGSDYSRVCQQIAHELRLPIFSSEAVSDELRTALFAASRCVVYPSIHREPFGMVPVEALAQATPAVVPDWGGVAGAIQAGPHVGGLHFRAWDSGHLAIQIGRLIEDAALHKRLSQAGPLVADYYSITRMADRVLAHLQIDPSPSQAVDDRHSRPAAA